MARPVAPVKKNGVDCIQDDELKNYWKRPA